MLIGRRVGDIESETSDPVRERLREIEREREKERERERERTNSP